MSNPIQPDTWMNALDLKLLEQLPKMDFSQSFTRWMLNLVVVILIILLYWIYKLDLTKFGSDISNYFYI